MTLLQPTASRSEPAPPPSLPAGPSRRTELIAVAVVALAAVVWWVLVPTYPNYDAYYHLVWGRELLDGLTPSFEAYAAPTPHPLELGVTAILGLAGEVADRLLVLVTLLSLVALVWAVWRLGRALFGVWPAALASLFVGSSFAFLLYAVRAYVDMPFLALVLWAAAVEVEGAQRARAGEPPPEPEAALRREGAPRRLPFVLLGLAGLLRPEGWVLAGLLWLWRAPRSSARERVILAALVAAPPIIWMLVDLAVTGDPLHSVRATSTLAEDLGRERGIGKVPRLFVTFLADVARPPVALAGIAGIALAVHRWGWRRFAIPLGLLAAGVIAYVGTGIAGLSILPRYLTVPAVALCLFGGYAVAGFTTLPREHPWRRTWTRAAALAAIGGVVFLIVKLPSFTTLTNELRFIRAVHDDLGALLATPEVRAGMRCGPLTFPNYRLVPDARWSLDAPRSAVGARSARRRATGVAVFVHGEKSLRRIGFADGASPSTNAPDPGFVRNVTRGRFTAYVSCP